MLSEQVIEQLVDVLVRRIERVNTYTLKKIAEAIKQIKDVPPSRAYDLAMILKYGGDYDKIVKELAKVSELNEKELKEIFKKVAKKNQVFAKQFYDYRNVKYIPYEKNIDLQNQVDVISRMTSETYRNLSKTLGFVYERNGEIISKSLTQAYQDTIDEAVLSIIQGKDSFNIAMNKVIKDLSYSGIQSLNWENGYHRRLDSSVRMNLLGAIRDFSINLQRQFGEEYGANGVEISVHDNPAPDHAEIQGHQFSTEKKENEMSEFDKLQNNQDCYDYQGNYVSKDYHNHDRRSIGEYNCYHYVYSVVLGVSKPQYSQKELDDINKKNNKGFKLDGKHYTMYQGTQLQRKLELAIRRQQDKLMMIKEGTIEGKEEATQLKITQLTNKYIELSKKSGLPTKMERLRLR